MPSKDRKAYWRFDADETNLVSTERSAERQPRADSASPVHDRGATPGAIGWPSAPRGGDPSVLRGAIDRGETRDKVAHPDPAAAPLGTDDEAAGAPATPDRVELAMRTEVRAPARPEGGTDQGRNRRIGLVLTAAVAMAAALAVIGLMA